MKKTVFKIIVLFVIFILILLSIVMFFNKEFKYEFENINANIDELYIYGNHLNLSGSIKVDNISKLELVLFNKKEEIIELNYEQNNGNVTFYISDKKNNGLLLDKLEIGNHIVFLKTTKEDGIKYYRLINKTDYQETEYYTIRNNDKFNYILIKEDKKNTLNISVSASKAEDIYDVVIDAGHGGIDTGACYKGACETDFTLKLSQKLKAKLEEFGLKVSLTRDESIKSTDKFETYGKDGRIDRAFVSKAKYLFSFHLNSGLSTRTGTEIYTTNHIDYKLAKSIVDNIVNNTNTNYSNNPIFRVDKGIYTRTFQKYEVNNVILEAKEKGYEPYNVTTDTTYYYIIRETGGFMNGAYVDGRDKDKNAHYNTNVGLESYIMELGYITSPKDTKDIEKNMDKYIEAIAKAIKDNICA